MPSGDVIIRFAPLVATATNLDNLSAQQMEFQPVIVVGDV
jgi:hypothetical protein